MGNIYQFHKFHQQNSASLSGITSDARMLGAPPRSLWPLLRQAAGHPLAWPSDGLGFCGKSMGWNLWDISMGNLWDIYGISVGYIRGIFNLKSERTTESTVSSARGLDPCGRIRRKIWAQKPGKTGGKQTAFRNNIPQSKNRSGRGRMSR